jgi:folate-binding protein YgfZ
VTPLAPDTAAVVDLSSRTKLRLTGADRLRFLNGQVSNDARLATAEASIYTCVMTIKGKMCADAFIHATGDALWLDAEPEVRESLAARLDKYIIADDVTLEDVSDDFGLLHILPGPGVSAEAAAKSLTGGSQPMTSLTFVRSERYGAPGLDLFSPAAVTREARAALSVDYPFLDGASLEQRRILAGVPKWGAELDENTMPAEAGLEERAVSFTKGCYIGQEVVSRVKSVGHVNRHLRGLRSSSAWLTAGLRLHAAGEEPGAREIGRITSVAADPADDQAAIALAFVRRGWETAGTVLDARPALSDDPAHRQSATAGPDLPPEICRVVVCELPFTS